MDEQTTQQGRQPAVKLIELKKTVQGKAKQYIIDLPDEDRTLLTCLADLG